jgi:hypothetical protein
LGARLGREAEEEEEQNVSHHDGMTVKRDGFSRQK